MSVISAIVVGLSAADCTSQCGSAPSSVMPMLIENYLNQTTLLGLTATGGLGNMFTAAGDYPSNLNSAILSAPCTATFNSHCPKGCNSALQQCLCSTSSDCPAGADCISGGCRTAVCLCYTRAATGQTFNLFPRTGCSGMPSAITCATGDCGPGLLCSLSASPPVTIFEAGWAGSGGGFLGPNPGLSVYDVSMVSGYNADVSVMPHGGCDIVQMSIAIKPAATIGWLVNDADTITANCPAVLRKPGSPFGCYSPQKLCGASSFCTTPAGTYTDCSGTTQPANYGMLMNVAGPSPGYSGVPSFPPTYTMISPNAGNHLAFSDSGCPTWGMQSPTPVVFTNLTYNALWQATGHKMCLITNASFIQAAAVATTQGLGGTPGTINCGTPQGVEGAACAYGSPDAAYTYRCRQATWTMSDGTSTSQLLCVPPLDPAVNTGLGKCVTLTQAQAQECSTNPLRCIGMAPLLYGLYAGVGGPINPVYAAVAKQISNPPFYEIFKSACPTCYSYSYDDPSSSFNAFDPGNTAGRYVPQPLSPLTAVTVRFGVAAGGLNIMDQARTSCGASAVCPFEVLPATGGAPPVACHQMSCGGRRAGGQLRVTPAVDCKTEACCYAAYRAAICAGVPLTSCFCNGAAIACPASCSAVVAPAAVPGTAVLPPTVPATMPLTVPAAPVPAEKGSKKGLLGLLGLLGIIPSVLVLACCVGACLRRRRKRGADVMFASFPIPFPMPTVVTVHPGPGMV